MAFIITYNSKSLSDNSIYFSSVKYMWIKGISYTAQQIDNNFWSYYNLKEWERQILVSGIMKKDTRANLLTEIDTLKTSLLEQNKTLTIEDENWVRWCTAICENISFSEDTFNNTWIWYEIIFKTFWYWVSTTATTYTLSSLTLTWTYTWTITRVWNAETYLYLHIYTWNSATTTSISVNIDGQIITVLNPSWRKNLYIDWVNKLVWFNDWSVELVNTYIWIFPKLKLTTNNIVITLTWITSNTSWEIIETFYPAYK